MAKPTYDELVNIYKNCELEREEAYFKIHRLFEIINNAIDYIKNNGDEIVYQYDLAEEHLNELLNILLGVVDIYE